MMSIPADQGDWRAVRVAPEDLTVVTELYAPDLSGHDAGALFWWARNRLFFQGNH